MVPLAKFGAWSASWKKKLNNRCPCAQALCTCLLYTSARELTPEEIEEDYEKNTGKVIIETFRTRGIDPVHVPGVLCASQGPFTWGKDAAQAVYHAVVLEEVAKMALLTCQINPLSLIHISIRQHAVNGRFD